MMTARMPTEIGVDDNIYARPSTFPGRGMGNVFADAGYDCGYGGKWHAPESVAPPDSGFDHFFHGTHAGLAEACARFLTDPARSQRPFLLVASFNEPHGICEWARGQAPPSGDVPDVDWRELPVLPGNFAPGSEEAAVPRLVQDMAWIVHPTQNWNAEKWRRYRHAYYRLCERVDAEIATVIDALDRSGHRDDTLILFTSDHGDGLGAHHWNQKKILYDEVVRVPFIVVPPASLTGAEGQVRDELVSVGLDLLPTLCDIAGIPADSEWNGRSVRPLLDQGNDVSWREEVVAETVWRFPGLMPPPKQASLSGRMVRTNRFTYLCYSWGEHREQLFDMDTDSGQMVNLATSGSHQSVLDDHRRRLAEQCRANGDQQFTRFIPAARCAPR